MSATPTITVFVLTRTVDDDELMERTVSGLAAGGQAAPVIHVVGARSPSNLPLPGEQSQDLDAAHVSPGRQVNDLVVHDESECLFLVTAGSVIHPDDLADAAIRLTSGGRVIVSGRTHEVTPPRPDADHRALWDVLRETGGLNRPDVSEARSSMSLLGLRRETYVELRGLDDAEPDSLSALEDLQARSLSAGVRVDPGPLVVRLATKLNALTPTVRAVEGGEATTARPPIYRNLARAIGNPQIDPPAVSIVISTYNRAPYLSDCLNSILIQSMPDFELVLVDDGSTDETEDVVSVFDDPRIRYFKHENAGISAARNFGLAQARGTFIAVHDDDDIMLPWRLATQLAMIQPGEHGCFGISVHFDEVTGETHNLVHRLFTMQTALQYGHNPTHPTWLLRRDVMASFGYDESLESGVDNNLALRMLRSGVRMSHTGVPLILRREHTGQITRTAGETQKASAGMSRRMLQFASAGSAGTAPSGRSEEWLPTSKVDERLDRVLPFMPDHLVRRAVTIRMDEPPATALALVESAGDLQFMRARFGHDGARAPRTVLTLTDVSWSGLVALRHAGAELEVTTLTADAEVEHAMDGALEQWSVEEVGSADSEAQVFVRAISNSGRALDGFIQQSELTGWAYLGMKEGEQRMAVVVELGDLPSAVALCGLLEETGLGVTELSILSREPLTDEAVHQALMHQTEVQP